MPDEISKTIVEQYGLAGFLLLVCIASAGFMCKWFMAQMDKKEASFSEYIQNSENNRLAAEIRYQTSIERITTEFKGALREVASESKDAFNKLATAIDELKDRIERG